MFYRFSRTDVIEGLYAGADRHNGEIAAYHLGRLENNKRTNGSVNAHLISGPTISILTLS